PAFCAVSDTSFQHGTNASGSGLAYTGIIAGGAVGNAVIHAGSLGDITCNQAPISGNITNAGSTGNPALGNFDTSDFKNSGSEVCPDTITVANHVNFTSQGLPWGTTFSWLDNDNDSSATPNATVVLSNVSIFVELD